jgi:uncharacterized integral membrane protein
MGEKSNYQPLTREDIITVVIYRAGIFFSVVIVVVSAILAAGAGSISIIRNWGVVGQGPVPGILLLMLYFCVGLSVFFIHLYVGKFHRMLKKMYYAAVVCLTLLFIIGKGDPVVPLFTVPPYGALLLVPLSLCLGFVTAKEAFCFQLIEGYIIALLMPAYIFLYSVSALTQRDAAIGLCLIAAILVFFMFRKVFMPIHYDIGDKSAYQL